MTDQLSSMVCTFSSSGEVVMESGLITTSS